jgi:hypothetical protein
MLITEASMKGTEVRIVTVPCEKTLQGKSLGEIRQGAHGVGRNAGITKFYTSYLVTWRISLEGVIDCGRLSRKSRVVEKSLIARCCCQHLFPKAL